jgi:hypothetical protein
MNPRMVAVSSIVLLTFVVVLPYKRVIAEEVKTMQLTSTAFVEGEEIPKKYTCEGTDISPQLKISNVPEKAESLALIVDDPDAPDPAAPKTTWVHWVIFNLPPDIGELPEGVTANQLPGDTTIGINDWQRAEYGGPCPPIGRHRYFFKLYALDEMLIDLGKVTKARLESMMRGHILAETQLMGTYQKGQ